MFQALFSLFRFRVFVFDLY